MAEFEMEKISSSESQGQNIKSIKILVVGDLATGKTSIVKQYLKGEFSEAYKTTIGFNYTDTYIDWDDNSTINLQFWDINGFERFENMTHIYYRGSSAAIVVFDVIRPNTLEVAKYWKNDIDEKAITSAKTPIPCLLVGNKVDFCQDGKWYKTKDEIENFVISNNFIGFFETSAKNGQNINDIMNFLVRYVMDNHIEPYISESKPKPIEDIDDHKTSSCFH